MGSEEGRTSFSDIDGEEKKPPHRGEDVEGHMDADEGRTSRTSLTEDEGEDKKPPHRTS
jgi:hypothetical protein